MKTMLKNFDPLDAIILFGFCLLGIGLGLQSVKLMLIVLGGLCLAYGFTASILKFLRR